MSDPQHDLRTVISSKTDEELYDMLYVHSADYTEDAHEIARQEFGRRKPDEAKMVSLGSLAEEQRDHEEECLGWPLRIVAFFFSTVFLGIPVILAHRNFVERGARRKAREWGRWALYGLLFYVGVLVARNALHILLK